nr:hypothetical protein HK105_001102 [Polyrhizophydium stewartii]
MDHHHASTVPSSAASGFMYPNGWHAGSRKHIPKERRESTRQAADSATVLGLSLALLLVIFVNWVAS